MISKDILDRTAPVTVDLYAEEIRAHRGPSAEFCVECITCENCAPPEPPCIDCDCSCECDCLSIDCECIA